MHDGVDGGSDALDASDGDSNARDSSRWYHPATAGSAITVARNNGGIHRHEKRERRYA